MVAVHCVALGCVTVKVTVAPWACCDDPIPAANRTTAPPKQASFVRFAIGVVLAEVDLQVTKPYHDLSSCQANNALLALSQRGPYLRAQCQRHAGLMKAYGGVQDSKRCGTVFEPSYGVGLTIIPNEPVCPMQVPAAGGATVYSKTQA